MVHLRLHPQCPHRVQELKSKYGVFALLGPGEMAITKVMGSADGQTAFPALACEKECKKINCV